MSGDEFNALVRRKMYLAISKYSHISNSMRWLEKSSCSCINYGANELCPKCKLMQRATEQLRRLEDKWQAL